MRPQSPMGGRTSPPAPALGVSSLPHPPGAAAYARQAVKPERLGQTMGRASQGLLLPCCQHPAQAGPCCPSILTAPLLLCRGCRAGGLSITATCISTDCGLAAGDTGVIWLELLPETFLAPPGFPPMPH